jgi:hypothetical protein
VLGFPTSTFDGLLALALTLGLLEARPVPLGLFVASAFTGRHATQIPVVVDRGSGSGGSNKESGSSDERKEGGFHGKRRNKGGE